MLKKGFIIILFFLSFIKSDLPVHCTISEVIGEWTFYLNNISFNPSLKNEYTTCGHGFPNKIEKIIGDNNHLPFYSKEKITFTLSNNYLIYQNGNKVGEWTPVYDQAFIIKYHKSILTATYKYYVENENSNNYVSNCGKTLVGWIIRDSDKKETGWSCMFGIKKSNPFNKKISFVKKKSNSNKNNYLLMSQVKYDDIIKVVDEINNAKLSWNSEVYEMFKGKTITEMYYYLGLSKGFDRNKGISKVKDKLFNTHKINSKFLSFIKRQFTRNYSKSIKDNTYESFIKQFNQSVNEKDKDNIPCSSSSLMKNLNSHRIDNNYYTIEDKRLHEIDSQYVKDYNEIIKYLNTPLDEIDERTLPLNWDWRNVGGVNYVPDPELQGECGSCYTFSTIQSLESRLRIKTNNKDQTKFSVQFPISCNFYSEGCGGGYPIFVAKFLNEFEIVPRECFEYTQTNDKCSNVCDYSKYSKKYTVSEYGYLGGYYGATNEILMMKEIRARGPIPGNMKVPFIFNFYRSGIFSTKPLKENANKLSKTRLVDRNLSFESVEHSIILVGYGEEKGIKYWIGMNTWGTGWGERGYFKILRGENEQSIETMGDFFNIEISIRNKK